MRKIKSVKMKPKWISIFKTLGFFLCIFLLIFLFYRHQISELKKIGYSEKASNRILFSHNKRKVLSIGENKTLNLAFESDLFQDEYIDNYSKIKFVSQEHFLSNIHKLLKVGYSNNDINIIFAHGDDKSVTDFSKRDRVPYLEEFFSYDFAKLDRYDRYSNHSDETGDSEYDTIVYVNLDLDLEDYTDSVVVEKFSRDMLVNRHHSLREDFVPDDLVDIEDEYTDYDNLQCSRLALNAFREMYQAAEKDGYHIVINSAYRNYEDQLEVNDLYLRSYGQEYVDRFVARPGYSEHQTGLAFDIGSRSSSIFANSKEYQWMLEHAHEYGFIMRYDERYEDLTEFKKEPWHYRYVGKEIAAYIYEHNNMSLEEYYVVFIDK